MSTKSKLATIIMTAGAVMLASLAAIFLMGRVAIGTNGELVRYHAVIVSCSKLFPL